MMRTVALTLLYVASHGQVTPVWTTLVQHKQDVFAPRNGHAVAVFNDRLWLIGGQPRPVRSALPGAARRSTNDGTSNETSARATFGTRREAR